MKQLYVFIIFMIFSLTSLAQNWKNSAAKLSADPEIREQGLNELKAIKNLSEQLSESFKSERVLVLQVIRALEMKEFLPRLLEIISNIQDQDLSPDVIRTATYLTTEKNKKEIISLYLKKLSSTKISTTATLALLYGLQNFEYQIEEKDLLKYLEHSSYEVRIASVEIAQSFAKKNKAYNVIFKKAISTSPYQVRMMAYSEFLANTDLQKTYHSELTTACSQEKNDEANVLCQKLKKGKK